MSGELLGLVLERIADEGPLPYDRYLELALYHPLHGYYRRGARPPRDYITAPGMSPLFGRLIGRLVRGAERLVTGDGPLLVFEPGAGDGSLSAAGSTSADFLPLAAEGRARWAAADLSWGAAPPEAPGAYLRAAMAGLSALGPAPRLVVVANELFDSLPCRVVAFREGRWREVLVGSSGGRLVETEGEISCAELEEQAAALPRLEGARFEVCLRARHLLREAAAVAGKGLLVVMDYGESGEEAVERAVTGGTLRAFRGHSVLASPLEDPGGSDITFDVRFDDMIRWGEEAGWEPVHLGSLRDFMLALGLLEEVAAMAAAGTGRAGLAAYLAAKRFLVPEGLPDRFKALVLGKGLEAAPEQAARALGLS